RLTQLAGPLVARNGAAADYNCCHPVPSQTSEVWGKDTDPTNDTSTTREGVSIQFFAARKVSGPRGLLRPATVRGPPELNLEKYGESFRLAASKSRNPTRSVVWCCDR